MSIWIGGSLIGIGIVWTTAVVVSAIVVARVLRKK